MAINPKGRFLAVACVVVLASSLRLINAAGQAPLTSVASVTPAHTRNSEPAKRKSPPLTRLKGAPAAASPANHGGSHPPLAAARIAREGNVIASLQKRLERQEKLLALQQQQITKLVATLDELMNSVKGAREVSSESAPEHQGPQHGTSHADLALVRTGDAVANPPAGATAGSETPYPNLFASLQPPISLHLTGLAPSASLVPTTSSASSSPATPPGDTESDRTLHPKVRQTQPAGGGNLQGYCGLQVQWNFSRPRRWHFPVRERSSGP